MTLPGETEFVTAGKFLLATDRHGIPTGKFVYGRRDKWYDIARREGVTERDCEKIASAFAYPGFRLATAGG